MQTCEPRSPSGLAVCHMHHLVQYFAAAKSECLHNHLAEIADCGGSVLVVSARLERSYGHFGLAVNARAQRLCTHCDLGKLKPESQQDRLGPG